MDATNFGRLPNELRDIIYEYVYYSDHSEDYHIIFESFRPGMQRQNTPSSSIEALSATCKEVRAGALPVFYANAGFTIRVMPRFLAPHFYVDDKGICEVKDHEWTGIELALLWQDKVKKWLAVVGPRNCRHIGEVKLQLELDKKDLRYRRLHTAKSAIAWTYLFENREASHNVDIAFHYDIEDGRRSLILTRSIALRDINHITAITDAARASMIDRLMTNRGCSLTDAQQRCYAWHSFYSLKAFVDNMRRASNILEKGQTLLLQICDWIERQANEV